ncbi:SRPBCC family protein [Marinobacter sp. CHS3-4]|uniref:SRPBCC family protein n=1 Tax=Marinobacter sp. CHS3-4 TaxID=3045174 RepID=UPI0024B55727|nr:SRPBCC family protein [Marinobacter sp. CHS3-4]MDI9245390.1 SRPBCC family protein [Marinobacter sp. CHS3-4]
MKFEHIVQINDLTKPEIPPLTRSQVWEGLVLRARRPDKFLVGVEDYEILEQTPGYLKRCVQLPGVEVIDEVRFFAEYQVDYSILPSETVPASSLVMDIEEPEPGALFVRFSYHAGSIESAGDSMPYDEYLKQAYVMTDIDTVQIIRDLASTGAF